MTNGVNTAIETLSEDNLTLAFVKTRLLDHEVKLKNESLDSVKMLHVEVENKTESNRKKYEHTKSSQNYPQHYHKKIKGKHKNQFIKCNHCDRKGHTKTVFVSKE